jgi:hypothetical protein
MNKKRPKGLTQAQAWARIGELEEQVESARTECDEARADKRLAQHKLKEINDGLGSLLRKVPY